MVLNMAGEKPKNPLPSLLSLPIRYRHGQGGDDRD